MKNFTVLIILIFGVSLTFAQTEKPNLQVTGTVKEIVLQEVYPNKDSAFYITYIKLNLKLKNNGLTPIIFLQNKPLVKKATFFQTENGKEIFLSRTLDASSSFLMSLNDWEKLKRDLDKSTPPDKKTLTVNAGSEIEFEGFIRLNIPRFKVEQSSPFSIQSQTLDFIQKHSPAQIKSTLETWSTLTLVINGKSQERKKQRFANKLRDKWKNIGYLWTEDIEVEPITIDFNSIVFKKLI